LSAVGSEAVVHVGGDADGGSLSDRPQGGDDLSEVGQLASGGELDGLVGQPRADAGGGAGGQERGFSVVQVEADQVD
jgi:hypothetical protein